jgi:hypothetical protein
MLEQGAPVKEFWRAKYISDTSKYWHEFYKRNSDHFYKDRHYLHIVFPELGCDSIDKLVLLEVGSGVGNAVFPLLELNKRLFAYAIDHADSAVKILRFLFFIELMNIWSWYIIIIFMLVRQQLKILCKTELLEKSAM